MAVASSASIAQAAVVPASSFVTGSRARLSSCASVSSLAGVSNGSRLFAMATKKVSAKPKAGATGGKKSWLPGVRGGGNLVNPEWLDGS